MPASFLPIFELTRGRIVESTHYGAIAVVDSHGKLLASYGDPQAVAFLRSSAKPFQVMPFVERSGVEHFGLTQRELALACASHEGSQAHIDTARSIQEKVGITENLLQCGIHMPGDLESNYALIRKDQKPTPNYNNCSGKHSAMLAHAKMRGLPLDTYLDNGHPIQQDILATFADMCLLPSNRVELGVDGCSAPNFAVPLYNAALGYARLCDPHDLPDARATACCAITAAMTSFPEMISGHGEFDAELMKVAKGKIICKRGAEGYQAIGLLPGALAPDSPGVGITVKVMDGDHIRRFGEEERVMHIRPAIMLAILHQLGVLSSEQEQALSAFGPTLSITNHRDLAIGEGRPIFSLVEQSDD